jgi:proteasome lid subunit RPN8/RPN11
MRGRSLNISRSVIDSILSYAKAAYPREAILLLNGKSDKDGILIDGVEIPPLASHGYGFANFPLYMLPIDFSVVGTAHSHPSGVPHPSVEDLNNFYGRIMVIAVFPYETEHDVVASDDKGDRIGFRIIED